MNFFQHQDLARRNSRVLLALFGLAVISLIVLTTLFIGSILYFFDDHTKQYIGAVEAAAGGSSLMLGNIFSLEILLSVAALVGAVVLFGSLYRMAQLRSGGASVAESLGAVPVAPNTEQPQERLLLNVVEEMAIASGLPVPAVYLVEDSSINAFAAGNRPNDAVIGVTRGCISALSRDQLQGVIAHEFSHILNGDMRLNMKLLGLLNGILLIGLIGSMLMRANLYSNVAHRSHNRDKADLRIAAVGVGLVVIGYSGTFFGNLIKAAVSRQREFLADASAVQYTRNPDGIAGALKQIGLHQNTSLSHPRAEEFSHMYFSEGIRHSFSSLMATHPPLNERILRIEPTWDGSIEPVSVQGSVNDDNISHFAMGSSPSGTAPQNQMADTTDPLELVATPQQEHISKARQILDDLPDRLEESAREPFAARAILYNLLIQEGETEELQWQQLQRRAHPTVYQLSIKLKQACRDLAAEQKLPLFELCIPAIKLLSGPQWAVFRENIIALIKADKQVSVFEWALYRMLMNAVEPGAGRESLKSSNLSQLAVPIQWVLSFCAQSDSQSCDASEAAYSAAMTYLGLSNLPLLSREALSFPKLDRAIEQIRLLKPLQKPALLKALMTCVQHDGVTTPSEYELFRAIADCIDCPVPPLLSHQ